METYLLFCHGESSGRGSTFHDSTVEASPLTALIRETFADLQLPRGTGGNIKLYQRRKNPDAFDLCFYSNVDSKAYCVGGTYSAPEIAVFERTDFKNFAQTEELLRRRLQEFARRLLNGELEAANYI